MTLNPSLSPLLKYYITHALILLCINISTQNLKCLASPIPKISFGAKFKQEAQISPRDPATLCINEQRKQIACIYNIARGASSATAKFYSATCIAFFVHASFNYRTANMEYQYTTNRVDSHSVQVKIILFHPAQLAQF